MAGKQIRPSQDAAQCQQHLIEIDIGRCLARVPDRYLGMDAEVIPFKTGQPVEILRRAEIQKSLAANFTPYVGAAIIFLCLTIPCTRLADWALSRERRRTGATAIA